MTLLGYGTNLCVVVSVRGEIKYRGVIVKHMLRAVAVVHVPVHARHALQPMGSFDELGGGSEVGSSWRVRVQKQRCTNWSES